MFTVDITEFLATECMRDYSASVAEIGQDAGRYTWQACMEAWQEWQFLKPENMGDFRAFVLSSGGWTDDEVQAMPDEELQALCLQWIASDVRQCGLDRPGYDWAAIRADQESGRVPCSVYPGDDGRIYWECAE